MRESSRRVMTMTGVVVGHALVFMAFCRAVVLPRPPAKTPITVRFIDEMPKPVPQPASPVLVHLTAPGVAVTMPIVPVMQAVAEPAFVSPAASAAPAPAPAGPAAGAPEMLAGQLELQCPERRAPRYPGQARRQREQGEVQLRVEIDEAGRIASVSVVASSGSLRLDEAAREAVRAWRCQPAERDGRPVRAIALQTMDFVLQHP